MAYIPISQHYDLKYTLAKTLTDVAVFNDPTDANYVGMIQELTGLDSPEVRESYTELTEGDGGVHGSFYYSRRPITIRVLVFGHATAVEREAKIDKARRASNAMRGDGLLQWTPATPGAVGVQIPVRRSQGAFRETGGWNKELQISLVSDQSVIMSQTQNATVSTASGAGVAVENKGSYTAYPIIEITGVSVNSQVSDGHGGTLRMGPTGNTLTLASGEKIEIDTLNHSAKFTAGARVGQSGNRYIDFSNTTVWPTVRDKTNETFTLTGGGSMIVKWRHVWI